MTRMQIRDLITHEPFGTILTTNPELWAEWEEPHGIEPRHETEHDHNWAELFGIQED
jgi:hypothetical protein